METEEEGDESNGFNGGEYGESSQGWSDQDADYESPPWPGDGYASSGFGDETDGEGFVPKPLDLYAYHTKPINNMPHTTTQTWIQPCSSHYEDDSYGEETDEETYDDSYVQYSSLPPRQEKPRYIMASCPTQSYSNSAATRKTTKERRHQSNSLIFSGRSKDPEDYLRWESNMKQWLRANNIPKEDKLSYAVDALVSDAYKWWLKECTPGFYNKPVLDWGDLKARMYRVCEEAPNSQQHHYKAYAQSNIKERDVYTTHGACS